MCVQVSWRVLVPWSAFFQCVSAAQPLSMLNEEASEHISTFTVVLVACISILLIVFIISLCGGCTPMEVGSDGHAASSGRKSGTNYGGQYDSVATDANTRVLTAGMSLPNDPYQHQDQNLPYALHPEGAYTENSFAGYSAPQVQPTAPNTNYQQAYPGGMQGAQGYSGAMQGTQGYSGTHRSAVEDEAPPPNYYQATRETTQNQPGNQSTQPYGW